MLARWKQPLKLESRFRQMSSFAGSGAYETTSSKSTGSAPWLKPRAVDMAEAPRLKLFNTLTGEKNDFIPMKGRVINWYNCGPTTYDHAHVGHARNYLELDIVRRVLTDYFHYDVVYHTNITDIDDKIILRARKNKLIENYKVKMEKLNSEAELALCFEEIQQTLKIFKQSLLLKKSVAEAATQDTSANSRLRSEAEEELKQLFLKLSNFEAIEAKFTELSEHSKSKENLRLLCDICFDPLSSFLDKKFGAEVTDHTIFKNHAELYEKSFMSDMQALNVREPDVLTRVTEYVPQIIEFVQKIVNKGLAYVSNESVYLDIEEFKGRGYNYRKLDPGTETSERELAESEGALAGGSEKKNKNDFVLWKASKPGEPSWESPFGKGRPGWHIECSVVASDIFPGVPLDIHSGGEDLKFPHHDNELAQSEACLHPGSLQEKQWVNYFTHVGHLHIKGLKMSKSLKNFITIQQCLEHHTARQLRLLVLLSDREKGINFSDQTVDEAKSREATLKNFFATVKFILRELEAKENLNVGLINFGQDRALLDQLISSQDVIHKALLDNIDTRTAMLQIFELVTFANSYLNSLSDNQYANANVLRKVVLYISKILGVFGVTHKFDDFEFLSSGNDEKVNKEEVLAPYLDAFVMFRDQIRNLALGNPEMGQEAKTKVLKLCDELRDTQMTSLGVRLEDRVGKHALWKLDDPETLRNEIREAEQAKAEAKMKKREMKVKALKATLEKMLSVKDCLPEEFFASKYAGRIVVQDGKPVREVVEGEEKEVTKSRSKSLLKEQKAYEKLHQKMLKEADGNLSAAVERLQNEVSLLELELL